MESTTDMQTTPDDAFSYVAPVGYRQSSRCGYCRRSGIGRSFYARARSMSPAYYQSLIDRCWRRSGTLLYKPNQRDACCPHYTIRLDSSQFRATKDQRQAINRFNKHIIGDEYAKVAARMYPRSREQSKKREHEFDLVERIHEAEARSLKQPPQPSHSLSVTLEPDDFSEEKYAVFENYQRLVHKEGPSSISRDGFKRFLCNSPLRRESLVSEDGKERSLGSFHHCYRLDGQLVAIGVLDLLPDCVSAVYFLYHESFHQWSPGKLGALWEIALAAEQGYRWWYAGFYIHTCPKMRYKIDFKPQYVLDPEQFEWVLLEKDLTDRFDGKGYLHFPSSSSPTNPAPARIEQQVDSDAPAHGSENGENEDEEDDGDEESLSLFDANMPGIPSLDELRDFDFDHIPVRLKRGLCWAGALLQWDGDSVKDPTSAKGIVAELVAAVGPDLMAQTCLDFRSS